jgi:hypothetical protein
MRELLARGCRAVRQRGAPLGAAVQQIAERLRYRPREVGTIALLAGGLFVGLGVEQWREAHPALALRLESEPTRRTLAPPAPPRRRPREPAFLPGRGCSDADAGDSAPPAPSAGDGTAER